jgi:hypothetical protein
MSRKKDHRKKDQKIWGAFLMPSGGELGKKHL